MYPGQWVPEGRLWIRSASTLSIRDGSTATQICEQTVRAESTHFLNGRACTELPLTPPATRDVRMSWEARIDGTAILCNAEARREAVELAVAQITAD